MPGNSGWPTRQPPPPGADSRVGINDGDIRENDHGALQAAVDYVLVFTSHTTAPGTPTVGFLVNKFAKNTRTRDNRFRNVDRVLETQK